MLLIQFRKKQEMDTQTGFWGQTTGDRKHRYIGKHTYGIKIRDLVRKTAFGINFSVIGIEKSEQHRLYISGTGNVLRCWRIREAA